MPSLRKKVSTYLRQLSFHNEPSREKRQNINENSFITKYLQGFVTLRDGPSIMYGKNPPDLPNYELGEYERGPGTILGCYTGPKGGLTTVKRTEKHLSVPDQDTIDFIDTAEENEPEPSQKAPTVAPPDDSCLSADWTRRSDLIYGISDSLYDRNQVTHRKNGDPIADCFGLITRTNSAVLVVADGVNWGEKASIAAKSAVHGCLHYLNKTLFADTTPFDGLSATVAPPTAAANTTNRTRNTRDVFVALLRAFNCAHDLILENQGMLTTLTVAVVMPLKRRGDPSAISGGGTQAQQQRYVCCVCNVGDTLAYVYSQRYGLREMTKGSHDINCNRDMRDALGALGPVDGINPELSNLTLSITTLNKGDIVMVASDGLTDNFDPNVCRFTVNSKLSEIAARIKKEDGGGAPVKPPRASRHQETVAGGQTRRQPSKPSASSTTPGGASVATGPASSNTKLSRSKTAVEMSRQKSRTIVRNEDGIPYVTPLQRYELQLLLMEDVLKNGISGKERPCATARELCERLVNFTFSITNAKRRTLEDPELYYDSRNGVLVEVTPQEKKLRRKSGLDRVQNLPGKLDHVSVVAWNVGNAIA